jgi:hypothetical protein
MPPRGSRRGQSSTLHFPLEASVEGKAESVADVARDEAKGVPVELVQHATAPSAASSAVGAEDLEISAVPVSRAQPVDTAVTKALTSAVEEAEDVFSESEDEQAPVGGGHELEEAVSQLTSQLGAERRKVRKLAAAIRDLQNQVRESHEHTEASIMDLLTQMDKVLTRDAVWEAGAASGRVQLLRLSDERRVANNGRAVHETIVQRLSTTGAAEVAPAPRALQTGPPTAAVMADAATSSGSARRAGAGAGAGAGAQTQRSVRIADSAVAVSVNPKALAGRAGQPGSFTIPVATAAEPVDREEGAESELLAQRRRALNKRRQEKSTSIKMRMM